MCVCFLVTVSFFFSVTTSWKGFLALQGEYNTQETGLAQLVVNNHRIIKIYTFNFKSSKASFLSTLHVSLKGFFCSSRSLPLFCPASLHVILVGFFYVFSVSSFPHGEQEHISKEALILKPKSR